jgi:hypothetical protein
VRMSLMACSFSTVCLLSRFKDLTSSRVNTKFWHREKYRYFTIYQSRACSPRRFTESGSTNMCRISRYAAARHCLVRLSARVGITLPCNVRFIMTELSLTEALRLDYFRDVQFIPNT